MDETTCPVDEGDKIELADEEGVYVVSWTSRLSVKAEEAGARMLADSVSWDPEEFTEAVDAGEIRVLSEDAPTSEAAREMADHVDIPRLTERLEGRGGGLRPSKPQAQADDGLVRYAWRMARFHSGRDTSMPVMAASDLQAYVDEELDAEASVSGVTDEAGQEVRDVLEKAIDAVLVALDEDPSAGVRRWEQTGILG